MLKLNTVRSMVCQQALRPENIDSCCTNRTYLRVRILMPVQYERGSSWPPYYVVSKECWQFILHLCSKWLHRLLPLSGSLRYFGKWGNWVDLGTDYIWRGTRPLSMLLPFSTSNRVKTFNIPKHQTQEWPVIQTGSNGILKLRKYSASTNFHCEIAPLVFGSTEPWSDNTYNVSDTKNSLTFSTKRRRCRKNLAYFRFFLATTIWKALAVSNIWICK